MQDILHLAIRFRFNQQDIRLSGKITIRYIPNLKIMIWENIVSVWVDCNKVVDVRSCSYRKTRLALTCSESTPRNTRARTSGRCSWTCSPGPIPSSPTWLLRYWPRWPAGGKRRSRGQISPFSSLGSKISLDLPWVIALKMSWW